MADFPASAPMPLTRDSLQIARLEEQFTAMRETIQAMAEEMRESREAAEKRHASLRDELAGVQKQLTEARGGWRTLMLLGGAVTSLAGLWAWLSTHIRYTP